MPHTNDFSLLSNKTPLPVTAKKPVVIPGLPSLVPESSGGTAQQQANDSVVDFRDSGSALLTELQKIEKGSVALALRVEADAVTDLETVRSFAAQATAEEKASRARGDELRANAGVQLDRLQEISEMNPLKRNFLVLTGRTDLIPERAQRDAKLAVDELNLFQQGDTARRTANAESVQFMGLVDDAENNAFRAKSAALTTRAGILLQNFGIQQDLVEKATARAKTINTSTANAQKGRDAFLAGSSPLVLQTMLGQLDASGTEFLNVQGHQIGRQDLIRAGQTIATEQIQLRTAQLAGASGEIEGRDLIHKQLLRARPLEELFAIQEADGVVATEGGSFQINPDLVLAEITTKLEADEKFATQKFGASASLRNIGADMTELGQEVALTQNRVGLLTGQDNIPPSFKSGMARIVQDLDTMIPEPDANGQINVGTGEINVISKGVRRLTDEVAAQGTKVAEALAPEGKSPELVDSAKAFIDDEFLGQRTAMAALVDMAITGPPAGVTVGTASEAGFLAMRQFLIGEFGKQLGQDPNASPIDLSDPSQFAQFRNSIFDKLTGKLKADNPAILSRAADVFYAAYGQIVLDSLFAKLPEIASNNPIETPNGPELHALAALPSTVFKSVLTMATTRAEATVSGTEFESDLDKRKALAAEEAGEIMNALSLLIPTPAAQSIMDSKGFETMADVFVDFLDTQEFDSVIANMNELQAKSSFPNFLAQRGANVANRLGSDLQRQLGFYSLALEQTKAKILGTQADQIKNYGDRTARSRTILGAIGSRLRIDDGTLDRFNSALESTLTDRSPERAGLTKAVFAPDQVDQFILNGSFEDPELEKTRKAVAKIWIETSTQMDAAMARLAQQKRQGLPTPGAQ